MRFFFFNGSGERFVSIEPVFVYCVCELCVWIPHLCFLHLGYFLNSFIFAPFGAGSRNVLSTASHLLPPTGSLWAVVINTHPWPREPWWGKMCTRQPLQLLLVRGGRGGFPVWSFLFLSCLNCQMTSGACCNLLASPRAKPRFLGC